jgi:hypothetical protein
MRWIMAGVVLAAAVVVIIVMAIKEILGGDKW